MPELPEVETMKQILEPQLRGLTIESILANRPEVIAHPSDEDFCRRLLGQTFSSMGRRGKYLIFHMENKSRILLHLRMTGCILLAPADYPEEKHTHLVFRLSGEKKLLFSDTRRFGRFWLFDEGEADSYSGAENLGLEPFSDGFTVLYLKSRLGSRKKAINECLMDQSVIAGIGNIYSDEILFSAGISPGCPAGRLKEEDWERLAVLIPERLSYFIEKDRLTPEEYLETKGKDYRNAPYLQVYGQAGKPCPVCGRLLCKSAIGGRTSTFCPTCQKERS